MVFGQQDCSGEQIGMDNMETMQGTEESIIYRNDIKTQEYGDADADAVIG